LSVLGSMCSLLQAACRLTCVVAGYIYPHCRALPLARPSLLGRAGAVEVWQREAAALGSQLGEVELGMVVRSLHQRLEVEPAVHQAVLHAEVVARGQGLVASGAREAAQMVHGVTRSHHHFCCGYPEVAACTPLHGEPSGTDTSSRLLIHYKKNTRWTGQTQKTEAHFTIYVLNRFQYITCILCCPLLIATSGQQLDAGVYVRTLSILN